MITAYLKSYGFLAFSIVISICGCAAQPQWRSLAPLPQGNGGFAAGILEGQLVVAGGTDWREGVKLWLDDIWKYEPRSNQWRQLGNLPHAWAYGGFGIANGKLMLLGGMNHEIVFDEIIGLQLPSSAEQAGRLAVANTYGGSAAVGSDIYLLGGSNSSELAGQTQTFYRINGQTGQVQRLSDYPGGKILFPTVAAANGRIYAFCGCIQDEQTQSVVNRDQAYVYDTREDQWRPIRRFPFARRGVSACALNENWILIGGGYGRVAGQSSEEFTTELYLYSVVEDRYVSIPPLPYAASGAVIIRDESTVYLLGGEDRERHRTNRLYSSRWAQWIPSH